ncbi:MAG: metal-dependent hydrolase [Mycobacteriaceae bacterium]
MTVNMVPSDALATEVPEPDNIILQARNVKFDWNTLPMHWVPGDPFVTHTFNVLHLLLPAGEDWFVETFKEALPLIQDENLREQVIGFIGQEAVHSQSHTGVLVHLKEKGLDPTPFTDQMNWFFGKVLGPNLAANGDPQNNLVERLSVIAAIEHVTAFLGDWVLNAQALDSANIHPTMLDLLRWHGAEEVEHRCVAHDVLQYFDKRYSRRIRTGLIIFPALWWIWIRGVRFLMAHDPELSQWSKHRRKPHWSDFFAAGRRGMLPKAAHLFVSMSRSFKPHYHPRDEGSTAQAVKYLASSPAALAASR